MNDGLGNNPNVDTVMAFTVTTGKIVHIDVLMGPDRLDRLSTWRSERPEEGSN